MNSDLWHEDRERAIRDSRVRPMPVDSAPNHVRCCHYNGQGRRCKMHDGHLDDHVESKKEGL